MQWNKSAISGSIGNLIRNLKGSKRKNIQLKIGFMVITEVISIVCKHIINLNYVYIPAFKEGTLS
jgi:hypothetical protein